MKNNYFKEMNKDKLKDLEKSYILFLVGVVFNTFVIFIVTSASKSTELYLNFLSGMYILCGVYTIEFFFSFFYEEPLFKICINGLKYLINFSFDFKNKKQMIDILLLIFTIQVLIFMIFIMNWSYINNRLIPGSVLIVLYFLFNSFIHLRYLFFWWNYNRQQKKISQQRINKIKKKRYFWSKP